jgi:hypothetical protein
MARIRLANDAGGILNAFGPDGQARAKDQLSAALDGLRQLIGNANIASGSSESTDPLTAPFVLYVNPYIGRDTFVAGSYNTKEAASGSTTEQVVAQKLKRLENQRLTCGYTRHAPFKTILRARIEAAIITSKNWYINDPLAHVDCVVTVLAPGLHIDYTNPSSDGIAVTQWADGFEPTWQHLVAFNPAEGGTLNPRGCSIVSEFGDLRHTIVRPSWVPNGNVDEIPAYSNGVATYALRRQMWKVTGGGYAYGISFMDKLGLNESHHLLSVFGHATKAELDEFYGKVFTACGSGGNLSQALLAARGTEYTIAAPISGTPTQAWDSTASASFYIFQCSVRSNFGLGRLWVDGSKVLGFKSFVCANFTGVSLQKSISEQGDMRCWQKYSSGNWVAVSNYQDYISQAPDNLRMHPARRSVGIGVINEGFVQKVSIFDIGEGAQSLVDTGGEIDSNNGNSSFGGVAGLAKGYRRAAFPNDKNWQISAIKVPLSPEFKTGNIQRFYLGTVAAFTSSSLTLAAGLAPYGPSSTVPDLLGQSGYSLPPDSYLWVENPQGADWRAPMTGSPWSSATPAQINISAAITDPSGAAVGVGGNGASLAIGARVYVRRLVDVRTPAERRLSIKLSNTTSARIPSASSVLQVETASSAIARTLSASNELLLVTATGVGDAPGAGVLKTAEVTLRRGGTPITYANGTTYRAGTVVLHANKHYINSKELTTANSVPDPTLWQETYVHMESMFAPEDNLKNEAPILIFDTDTDGAETTTTCGINWATVWTAAGSATSQYRTGTDYLGAFLLLSALGYGASDAHAALIPRAEAARSRNPALTSSSATTLALSSVSPSGGAANAAVNWPVEFRRPSTLWMGSHRWFGSGLGNYSKAVPAAAQDMSAQNRFTYYFTSQGGGRVIPQGSQEDGLLVSPRGLEDTTTGQTLSVESIGAGDINASQGTSFPTLSVGDLTVTGLTTLDGQLAISESTAAGAKASTVRYGFGTLANAAALRSSSTITGANDDALDASLDNRPELVTLPGLNYWARQAGVVTRRTGVAVLYVAPDNAVNASTYNFNGVNAALIREPNRTGADLFDNPPTTRANAVLFSRATEYANAIFSSEETVEYRLADGPYWNDVSFNHIANVIGALDEFPETNTVASWTTASTKPTTNVKALHDANTPFRCPCFASFIAIGQYVTSGWIGYARPTKLTFNQVGSIRGIGWLSTTRTLADTANFPSSLYGALAGYRSSGISFAAFMDTCINGLVPAGHEFATIISKEFIEARSGQVSIADVFIGSQSPGRAQKGFGDPYALIRVKGASGAAISGIYLIGNVRLASGDLPLSTAKGVTFFSALMFGTQHSQNLVGGFSSNESEAFLTSITFPARYRTGLNPAREWQSNYDTNCIHVLDDNGDYGLMANRASSTSNRGATLEAIIGDFNPGSTLYLNGFSRSIEENNKVNQFAGVAGVFGNAPGGTKGPWGLSPIPYDALLLRPSAVDSAVWRSAIVGAQATFDVTLSPTPGGAQESYTLSSSNPNNIRTQAFFRGINVSNNITVGGSLFSNRFFA